MSALQSELKMFCEKWNISEEQVMKLLGNIQTRNGIQTVVADLQKK
jgi:hypothetical protein